jgi:hypothetical protein
MEAPPACQDGIPMCQISAKRAKSIDMQTHYRIKETTKLKIPKILTARMTPDSPFR